MSRGIKQRRGETSPPYLCQRMIHVAVSVVLAKDLLGFAVLEFTLQSIHHRHSDHSEWILLCLWRRGNEGFLEQTWIRCI